MNNATHYVMSRSLIQEDEWTTGHPGEPPILAGVKIEGDTVTLHILDAAVLFHDEFEYQFRPR